MRISLEPASQLRASAGPEALDARQLAQGRFHDTNGIVHTVPRLEDSTRGDQLPMTENGSAEPLAAPNERANISYIADVVLSNTALRQLRRAAAT